MENISTNKIKKREEIEELKSEILKEITSKKDKKKLHWGSTAVTGLLVLLTFFSVVQTVQSANILGKINSGAIKSSDSGSVLPSSIQNLPNMVGGC